MSEEERNDDGWWESNLEITFLDRSQIITAFRFTGDVGRAKCKSTLLHFRAEEPETGAPVYKTTS